MRMNHPNLYVSAQRLGGRGGKENIKVKFWVGRDYIEYMHSVIWVFPTIFQVIFPKILVLLQNVKMLFIERCLIFEVCKSLGVYLKSYPEIFTAEIQSGYWRELFRAKYCMNFVKWPREG